MDSPPWTARPGERHGKYTTNHAVRPDSLSNHKMNTKRLLSKSILVIVLVAGLVTLLTYLPGPGEQSTDPTATDVAGQSEGVNAEILTALNSDAGAERLISVTDLSSIAYSEAEDNTVVEPAQEGSGGAQATISASAGTGRETETFFKNERKQIPDCRRRIPDDCIRKQ